MSSVFLGRMEESPTVLRTSDFKATALSTAFFFPNQVASELLKGPIILIHLLSFLASLRKEASALYSY